MTKKKKVKLMTFGQAMKKTSVKKALKKGTKTFKKTLKRQKKIRDQNQFNVFKEWKSIGKKKRKVQKRVSKRL